MKNSLTRHIGAAIVAALLCIGAPVLAATDKPLPPLPQTEQEMIARIKTADKNGDGKITREEAQQSLPRVAMAWENIDVDKKGYVTVDQLLMIVAANK